MNFFLTKYIFFHQICFHQSKFFTRNSFLTEFYLLENVSPQMFLHPNVYLKTFKKTLQPEKKFHKKRKEKNFHQKSLLPKKISFQNVLHKKAFFFIKYFFQPKYFVHKKEEKERKVGKEKSRKYGANKSNMKKGAVHLLCQPKLGESRPPLPPLSARNQKMA